MTNRELYKRGFDKLRPTEEFQKEMQAMLQKKGAGTSRRPKRIITLAAAVVVILSLAVAASATGALRNIRVWIGGKEVDATQYVDKDGNIVVNVDEGDGVQDVIVAFGDDQMADVDPSAPCAGVAASYARENGRDLVRFTQEDTGKTQDVDITGQLAGGRYEGDLEAFGQRGHLILTFEGEGLYSIDWSAEDTPARS